VRSYGVEVIIGDQPILEIVPDTQPAFARLKLRELRQALVIPGFSSATCTRRLFRRSAAGAKAPPASAGASRSVAASLAATVGELGQSRGQRLKDLRVY
jgi:hypothetical protein